MWIILGSPRFSKDCERHPDAKILLNPATTKSYHEGSRSQNTRRRFKANKGTKNAIQRQDFRLTLGTEFDTFSTVDFGNTLGGSGPPPRGRVNLSRTFSIHYLRLSKVKITMTIKYPVRWFLCRRSCANPCHTLVRSVLT